MTERAAVTTEPTTERSEIDRLGRSCEATFCENLGEKSLGSFPDSEPTTERRTGGAFEAVVMEARGGEPLVLRAASPKVRARPRRWRARVAVPGYQPSAGDRVLALHVGRQTFVVGVVHAPAPARAPLASAELRSDSGASARIEDGAIVVRDPVGAIVATYDPSTGSTRVCAAAGDLVLDAPHGRVVVRAGTDLELRAAGAVRTEAPRVEVRADEQVAVVGRSELHAARLLEHVTDVYREIDGMLQIRAGRMRTLVRDAYRLLARRTSVISEEDTSIDGKRVLLG